jgi:hypothetical protein
MAPLLGLLVAAYIVGRLLYFLLIDPAVPGGWERRVGRLEPLPPDIGKWKEDVDSDLAKEAALGGLRREVRLFHDPRAGDSTLLRQVRYRSVATHAIVRAEPDVRVARRRQR